MFITFTTQDPNKTTHNINKYYIYEYVFFSIKEQSNKHSLKIRYHLRYEITELPCILIYTDSSKQKAYLLNTESSIFINKELNLNIPELKYINIL